jgi:hypothetical protein
MVCNDSHKNLAQQIKELPEDQIVFIDNDPFKGEMTIIARQHMPIHLQEHAQEAFEQGYSIDYKEYRDSSIMLAKHISPFVPGDYILLGAHKELKKK